MTRNRCRGNLPALAKCQVRHHDWQRIEPDEASINREFNVLVSNYVKEAPTSLSATQRALAEISRGADHGIIYARQCLTAGQAFEAGEKRALQWMYLGYADLRAAAGTALHQVGVARNPTAPEIWKKFESAHAPTAVLARQLIAACLRRLRAERITFDQLPEGVLEALFLRIAGTNPYGVATFMSPEFRATVATLFVDPRVADAYAAHGQLSGATKFLELYLGLSKSSIEAHIREANRRKLAVLKILPEFRE
jgi:hypothetical protein